MKRRALLITLALLMIGPSHNSNGAEVIKGDSCPKVGKTAQSQGVKYFCVKRDGKTVWGNGVKFVVPLAKEIYKAPTISSLDIKECMALDNSKERKIYNDLFAGFPNLEKYIPHKSTVTMALIPVDWADLPGRENIEERFRVQMQRTAEWYEMVSQGNLKIKWVVQKEWIRIPGNSKSFAVPFSGSYPATTNFWNGIRNAVDEKFDFTGVQVANVVMPSGQDFVIETAQDFPWMRDFNRKTNEGEITSYTLAGKFFDQPGREYWSYWAHEFGHVLQIAHIGSSRAQSEFHGYDLMGSQDGPYRNLNGWLRFVAGWLEPQQVFCQTKDSLQDFKIMLNPLNSKEAGLKIAVIRLPNEKTMIIESRRNSIYECDTGRNSGVLVYEYDSMLGNQEQFLKPLNPKPKPGPDVAKLCSPNTTWQLDYLIREGEEVITNGIRISVTRQGNFDSLSISKAA